MKLILVSQNKHKQIEYSGLEIFDTTTLGSNVHSYDIVYRMSNGKEMISLGSYSTKERALEVMDDVLNILKNNDNILIFKDMISEDEANFVKEKLYEDYKILCEENVTLKQRDYIVYEFPKE